MPRALALALLCLVTSPALAQVASKPPPAEWNFAPAVGGIVNTTTAVTIKAAAPAGRRNCIAALQVATDTLGAATELAVRDGAGGTVLLRFKLQTTNAPQAYELPAPLCGTGSNLIEIATLTAVTGGVFVNAQGYVMP